MPFCKSASAAGPDLLVGGSYGDGWQRRTTPADKGSLDYPLPDDRRNSFYLYQNGEQSPLRYDKTHLFPYGEYIPFKNWPPPIRWLYDLAQLFNPWGEEASVTPGTERTVFDLETRRGTPYRAVTPICFEDIIPPQTRALCYESDGTKRADVIVNGTNDGWFRGNQMEQHLQAALFRSVENRVPTVRSVNTGGTAVVDSTGRIVAKLPSGVAGDFVGGRAARRALQPLRPNRRRFRGGVLCGYAGVVAVAGRRRRATPIPFASRSRGEGMT